MGTADQHQELSEAENRLFAQGRIGGRRPYRPTRRGPEPDEAPDGAAGASGERKAADDATDTSGKTSDESFDTK